MDVSIEFEEGEIAGSDVEEISQPDTPSDCVVQSGGNCESLSSSQLNDKVPYRQMALYNNIDIRYPGKSYYCDEIDKPRADSLLNLMSDDEFQQSYKQLPLEGRKKRRKKRDWGNTNHYGISRSSERSICKFYAEGRCNKGDECPYSHAMVPTRKRDLCKFYAAGGCSRGSNCQFLHGDFPCKFYHLTRNCYHGENCKFSHAPLTKWTSLLLENLVPERNHEQSDIRSDYSGGEGPSLLGSSPKLVLRNGHGDVDYRPILLSRQPRMPFPSAFPSIVSNNTNKDFRNNSPSLDRCHSTNITRYSTCKSDSRGLANDVTYRHPRQCIRAQGIHFENRGYPFSDTNINDRKLEDEKIERLSQKANEFDVIVNHSVVKTVAESSTKPIPCEISLQNSTREMNEIPIPASIPLLSLVVQEDFVVQSSANAESCHQNSWSLIPLDFEKLSNSRNLVSNLIFRPNPKPPKDPRLKPNFRRNSLPFNHSLVVKNRSVGFDVSDTVLCSNKNTDSQNKSITSTRKRQVKLRLNEMANSFAPNCLDVKPCKQSEQIISLGLQLKRRRIIIPQLSDNVCDDSSVQQTEKSVFLLTSGNS